MGRRSKQLADLFNEANESERKRLMACGWVYVVMGGGEQWRDPQTKAVLSRDEALATQRQREAK